ncbi:MAG TPA: amino acid permease [Gemmataceae bacterium]|nr:amino acid permease [Gemmataceae bacterium]
MDTTSTSPESAHAKLGLWDAVSIIVGIIIGVGIFQTPNMIFSRVPHPAYAIGLWVLGGVLAFIGALCFAELASAYPRSGGEYVYLTRAFGRLTGFLFAWSQLSVTRTGSIAGMAYIFGLHLATLFGRADNSTLIFVLAGLSVILLTAINVIGVRMGTRTQNVLTAAKVLGLAALVVVGFVWADPNAVVAANPAPVEGVWFASAMIFVLWAYSGWHEAAYIVAEAKNHTRNIPLALMIGTLIVTAIYVMVNLALLYGLDFVGAQDKNATENLIELAWPTYGARVMSVLIVISALGAINGMIFTTARIYSEFGKDHRIFRALSHWSKTLHTPARALVIQGGICVAMIAGVWFLGGGENSFDKTVKFTVAVFWSFFCLTGVSLIVLRERDAQTPRPFRVPGYPVLPIIFAAWCAYIVAGTIIEDYQNHSPESLVGVGILLVGLPLYFLPQKLRSNPPDDSRSQTPFGSAPRETPFHVPSIDDHRS